MARLAKSLLCKHKAPGMIPRAREKELGVVAHACNLSVGGKWKEVDSLGRAGQSV